MTTTPPVRTRPRAVALYALCLLPFLLQGCGKKGPPLAPLRLVPGPPGDLGARRRGHDVRLRFTVPNANLNGPGHVDIDRVEIYAITVGPHTPAPPNRELLTKARLVGVVPVKPPPVEGEAQPDPNAKPDPNVKPDTRPAPGEVAAFVETITPEKLQPVVLPTEPAPASGGRGAAPTAPAAAPAAPGSAGGVAPPVTTPEGAPTTVVPPAAAPPAAAPPPAGAQTPPAGAQTPLAGAGAPTAPAGAPAAAVEPGQPPAAPGAAPAAAPAPAGLPYPVRIYAVRGISHGGRPGQPSTRIMLPLIEPPPVPCAVKGSFTEKAVVVEWVAPVPQPGAPPVAFNVYRPEADSQPLNPVPLTAPKFEAANPELGKEQCFVVRGVDVRQSTILEGAASAPVCVTPRDIFAPATPQGVSILLLEGAIELVWDTNTEPDFGGYTVLRAEGADETLRPLTPVAIRETTFRDTNVKPGVRYVYAIVATDRAGNSSPPSARVEGTAR